MPQYNPDRQRLPRPEALGPDPEPPGAERFLHAMNDPNRLGTAEVRPLGTARETASAAAEHESALAA
jgi:hypothetical protein